MEPTKDLKPELNDQTIISGFGSSRSDSHDLDFSLDDLSIDEPEAASTAIPVKSRTDFLLANLYSKEDKENIPCPQTQSSESSILFSKTQSSARYRDFSHNQRKSTAEDAAHSMSLKQYALEDENFVTQIESEVPQKMDPSFSVLKDSNSLCGGRSDDFSNGSSLFPNSSILNQSKLISMSEEEIEETNGGGESSAVGIPSMMLEDRSANRDGAATPGTVAPWDLWSEPSTSVEMGGYQPTTREIPGRTLSAREAIPKLMLDNNTLESDDAGGNSLMPHSHIWSPSPSASFFDRGNAVDEEEDMFFGLQKELPCDLFLRDQSELKALVEEEGEIFHPANLSEFIKADDILLKQGLDEFQDFAIDESIRNAVPDLSGFMNVSEVNVRQSLWSSILEAKIFEPGKKICFEDVLAAKSCKMGSLDGGEGSDMPSFGFRREDVESPPKYVPDETFDNILEPSPKNSTFNVSSNLDEVLSFNLSDEDLGESEEYGGMERREGSTVDGGTLHLLDKTGDRNGGGVGGRFECSVGDRTEERVWDRTEDRTGDRTEDRTGKEKKDINVSSANSSESYLTLLRQLMEKAEGTTDVNGLIHQLVHGPNPSSSFTQSTFQESASNIDISTDVLEMRRYRRELLEKQEENERKTKIELEQRKEIEKMEQKAGLKTQAKAQVQQKCGQEFKQPETKPSQHSKPQSDHKPLQRSKSQLQPEHKRLQQSRSQPHPKSKPQPHPSKPQNPKPKPDNVHSFQEDTPEGKMSKKTPKNTRDSNSRQASAEAGKNVGMSSSKEKNKEKGIIGRTKEDSSVIGRSKDNSVIGRSEKNEDKSVIGRSEKNEDKSVIGQSEKNKEKSVIGRPKESSVIGRSAGRMRMGTGSLRGQPRTPVGPNARQISPILNISPQQGLTVSNPSNVDQPTSEVNVDPEWSKVISEAAMIGTKTHTEYPLWNPTSKMLKLSIHKIQVDVFSTDGEWANGEKRVMDFGSVPESCALTRVVTLVNKSPYPVPVLVNLKQDFPFESPLTWCPPPGTSGPHCGPSATPSGPPPGSSPEGGHFNLLSGTLAALELAPCSSTTAKVLFRAPRYDRIKDASGLVEMKSELEVTLDSPMKDCVLLATLPVTARIGEVLLGTHLTDRVLKIEAPCPEKGACFDLNVRNKSLLPLDLRVKVEGHGALSVSPTGVVLPLRGDVTLRVVFKPRGDCDVAEGNLLIIVESDGMEMRVPIQAVLNVPSQSSPSPSLSCPLSAAPVQERERHWSGQSASSEDSTVTTTSSQAGKLDKELSLLSSKPRFVFGCVSAGELASDVVTLRNRWTDHPVTLNVAVKGATAFYFDEKETGEKVRFRELVLQPEEETSLGVRFRPDAVRPFSGSLICKPRGIARPVKITFPLQGFGGKGVLSLHRKGCPLGEGATLAFEGVLPGTPATLNVSITNTGTRYIFVNLVIRPDESSENTVHMSDMCAHPSVFVLGPGQSTDFLIITTCSPSIMRRAPGTVGVLQAVYVDEVLRRRFKNLSSPSCSPPDWRSVPDLRLLSLKFDDLIPGERNALCEEDPFAPKQEDLSLLYNSCTLVSIPIRVESSASGLEPPKSLLDIVPNQDTVTSFLNDTAACPPSRSKHDSGPMGISNPSGEAVASNNDEEIDALVAKYNLMEFDVHPSKLKLVQSQKNVKELSVMNYTEEEQMFDVSCDVSWLGIDPREVCVEPLGFSIFKVRLLSNHMPRNPPKIIRTSIKVLGTNEEQEVKVEVEMDSFEKGCLPPPPLPLGESKRRGALPPPKGGASGSKVEITPEITFPVTKVGRSCVIKLVLKNLDTTSHDINISFKCQHFSLRHTDFTIKAAHCIQVPVYFKPKGKGNHVDTIAVKVLADEKVVNVQLNGVAK